ncbi:hypothetical protein [Alloalcanivorax xenomutans]|jgi:hypothetical protein|uniref:Uncharacterized protein n=1 Tax=Alloalcanivorax xenomutans TaxID=1094342 RepID=A0A9Q3W4X4_9GAMM|nr:hypothetical protein [Alloalcanivorax xenomutans]ERS11720.1 hypothetical protein Q668_02620 [Alcanivorax sp. PN-3]MBA4720604.1 hypothetical protein [Alcanivorax sp.]MCE7507882.1 hypothetical protein [Alloalcanivorax xenomutans]WOA29982.1 hypothetical protein RVY87_13950 [Alloalcanivorax xenomutans]WOD26931.1 hypothetical protein RYH70_12970 [Alloalcanivorax xenomutans]|tara:strand:+ start:799 stop:1020 length:222 start_codon:yes stop_codon:yes gene_type:complete
MMDISTTLLGQMAIAWAVLCAVSSYFLARKKVRAPVLAAVLGLFMSLVPPFALVYMAVLAFLRPEPRHSQVSA